MLKKTLALLGILCVIVGCIYTLYWCINVARNNSIHNAQTQKQFEAKIDTLNNTVDTIRSEKNILKWQLDSVCYRFAIIQNTYNALLESQQKKNAEIKKIQSQYETLKLDTTISNDSIIRFFRRRFAGPK